MTRYGDYTIDPSFKMPITTTPPAQPATPPSRQEHAVTAEVCTACRLDDDDHFAPNGLCQCGCADCATRLGLCTCLDCSCESHDDHAHWIWDDSGARRGGTP